MFSAVGTNFITSAEENPDSQTEKVFPDKDDLKPVDVNFAKALQLSLYFYDANKCGSGITGGRLEWRGDCHVEDGAIPLKPMGEDFKGTNLSQEFIDENIDILGS